MTIVATGMGAVSAVGRTRGALWEALAAGVDGIRPIQRFAIDGISNALGGLVPGYDLARPGAQPHRGLSIEFAVEAAREAWVQAGMDRARPAAHRIALVVGTSIGDDLHDPTTLDEITDRIGNELGIAGPRITVSTACTSSTNAIGLAKDLLDAGFADLVIAGGTDVLTPEIFAGFHKIGALSEAKCAPFSEPFGTTLGEGAGFVVLERRAAADGRGAVPLIAVLGYGLSADAFHETSPDPTGSGVARAITGALDTAGVHPHEIGYVNAHGTGTQANDPAEWRAIVRVFGGHADTLPVSSTKSLFGHAQGAAGVLEMLATILAMREHVIPQTLQFTRARAHGPRDPVGRTTPRPASYSHAVCTNSAFGGANAAVVISDPELAASATPRTRRAVYVRGVASVGAHGTTLDELSRVLAAGEPLTRREAAAFAIEAIVPTTSPRGLNPSSQFLTAAAALALADAGIRLRKGDHERAGLIAGATCVSPASATEFRTSIDQRGFGQVSAAAFARMVLNAPSGACSKILGLKGPNSTIDTGDGSGLVALAYAAHLLATRADADVIVAGGFDELDPDELIDNHTEGAACATLGVTGDIRIAGWGLAGAGRLDDAVTLALEMAALDRSSIQASFGDLPIAGCVHVDPRGLLGTAPASSSVVALVAAVLALRRGELQTVLVGTGGGRATACALILTTLEHRDGP